MAKQNAIGVLETNSLVNLIFLLNIMIKSSEIELVSFKYSGENLVSSVVKGDLASVKNGIEIGIKIAKEKNLFISTFIIGKSNESIKKFL